VDLEDFSEPEELWFKIVKAKYMGEGVSLNLKQKGYPNSGKGYIK